MTGNYVTCLEVTRSDPEVTSFYRKWTWDGCRRAKTSILGAFQHLHGCNSQQVAVTWQRPAVTQKWHYFTRSGLEKAAEDWKLVFWVLSAPTEL